MKKIYVSAPLGTGNMGNNVQRVIEAMIILTREAKNSGDPLPLFLVPHFVLNNITFAVPIEIDRKWGMECCLEMVKLVDEMIIIGKTLTPGMKEEYEFAKELGKKIIHRVDL